MNLKRTVIGAIAMSLTVCALGLAAPALAQNSPSQKQLDIAAARAQRKAVVGANMDLTPAEASAFWPVFDEYEAKMDKIDGRHIKELKDFAAKYQTLTDTDAAAKLDEVIAIQQARLDTQKAYVPKFRAVTTQIKVTRFFQIDNKLRALVQCDIAQMVPLAMAAPKGQ
jgi:Spy/CpxP family protein refolding chaperone